MQKHSFIKCSILIIFILIAFGLQASADYPEGERPVWGLTSDTAYTLGAGKFNISLLGWVTCGVSDRIQIGTNYLADVFQIYNAYWKFHLLDERGILPALSIGAIHYHKAAEGESTIDPSLNFTKSLDQTYTLYGGFSRFSTTSLLVNLIRGSSRPAFLARVGIIMNNAPSWHSFAEVGFDKRITLKDLGIGIEWASDVLPFRLKLGVYFPSLIFIPILDIYWRF